MVFDFFSVVGKGYVAPILVVQRSGGGRGQYDALVGRSEQHKIVRFVFAQNSCIKSCQLRQHRTRAKKARVKEIGTDAAGFEGKLTEP